MSRISRRFLLHNSKEDEDIKEFDIDELKQSFYTIKLDLNNDIRHMKQKLNSYTSVLFSGLSLVGEYFYKKNTNNTKLKTKFETFRARS
jgi:hypothetical protein